MAVAHAKRERQIGEILVEQGVISPLELEEALQRQRLTGDMLGRVLVRMGLCQEQDVVEALGVQSGMERVDLRKLSVKDDVLRRITPDIAKFYEIAPIREKDNQLVVAMADPLNIGILDDLHQITGMEIRGAISNAPDVAEFIKKHYSYETDSIHETLGELVQRVGDAELTAEEMGQQEIVADPDLSLIHI